VKYFENLSQDKFEEHFAKDCFVPPTHSGITYNNLMQYELLSTIL